jgi:hypothetical protein
LRPKAQTVPKKTNNTKQTTQNNTRTIQTANFLRRSSQKDPLETLGSTDHVDHTKPSTTRILKTLPFVPPVRSMTSYLNTEHTTE